MKKTWAIVGTVTLVLAALSEGYAEVDLLARYPTSLRAGDANPTTARPFDFTSTDVFRLSKFKLDLGPDLNLEMGPANVGLGRSKDGVVWAAIIPHAETSAILTSCATNQPEQMAHLWLRFHPREINHLFPPDTVFADGGTNQMGLMQAIVNTKFTSSWHAGLNAMIPEPKDLTVDADVQGGCRRFFMVDREAAKAQYVDAFEKRFVKPPAPLTTNTASTAFIQLWEAFDRDYAMFILRPEVDWRILREQYYPQALASPTTYEFAQICAEMLKPLRDLHLWMTVAGQNIPVFNRPRVANANPKAHAAILGNLQRKGRVEWTVTADQIGFIAIYGWDTGPLIPRLCDEALEAMRHTRGLIVDVRLNGGGDEPTALKVAGRFVPKDFIYAYSQFRNGPNHTNLTEKYPRLVQPRGPWRYNRPIVLLIGQKCMSSNESFIGMMTGDPDLVTMGDHTCGSSGNPKIVKLPFEITVSVPRWIDYRPDGVPLDERGFEPQVPFQAVPGAFEGQRDDLLTAALERLRQVPLPDQPIEGPAYLPEELSGPAGLRRPTAELPGHSAAIKEEAQDTSRPQVVSVSPAENSQVPAGQTELRLRFDRPMDPLSLKLDWEAGGFTDCEYPRYDTEKFEFIVPVNLPPGALQQIVVNKPPLGFGNLAEQRVARPRDGFQSSDHHLASVFTWRFKTQPLPPSSATQAAKAVRITPEPGSQVPYRTFAEIQFDQSMASPLQAHPYLIVPRGFKAPQMISCVEYDRTQRTFRLPLLLPPKEKVAFTLAGFRNAAGVLAAPFKLEYQVTETNLSKADRMAWETAAKEPRLLALLDTMKQKREQLTSVSERIQQLSLSQEDGLFTRLESKSATFKWQHPGLYYGDVTEMMLTCEDFRLGCDGKKWWFHSAARKKQQLIECPTNEMHEVNLVFCDPFGLLQKSPATVATELGLRHTGFQQRGTNEFQLVEAWNVDVIPEMTPFADLKQWWIDSRTGLPSEIIMFAANNIWRTRFLYDTLNEPLPTEAFAVPQKEGLAVTPPEELNTDYTRRFLILHDGSNGNLSLRWGKKGPRGISSSGLN